MKNFSTHWTQTILAAIILHIAAAFAFVHAMPLFEPAPKIHDTAQIEWIEIEFPDEVIAIDAQDIPSASAQESKPLFDAESLVVPELPIPEPIIELPQPVPPKIELPKPLQSVKPNSEPPTPPPKVESPTEKISDTPSTDRQLMGKPPVTVNEVYPEHGSGLGYKGYVSIAVRIGKDGKVKSTEILQSSGRYFVDEIALKAARQWTFRPALDQIGRPMECDKVISFDFKKFS